jgi:hypothetical protein
MKRGGRWFRNRRNEISAGGVGLKCVKKRYDGNFGQGPVSKMRSVGREYHFLILRSQNENSEFLQLRQYELDSCRIKRVVAGFAF